MDEKKTPVVKRKKGPNWPLIGGIAGLVLFAGGGTAFRMYTSNQVQPTPPGTGVTPTPEPTPVVEEPAPDLLFQDEVRINGAGASFPAIFYQEVFRGLADNEYTKYLRVDYASTGSGAGVRNYLGGPVQFGASDVAMKDEEIAKFKATNNGKEPLMLPVVGGSIVLAYNVPGLDSVNLSREAYTKIFMGEITKWNDPVIAAANPGVELPDLAITVVVRSDGSGTTGVFTKHLSAISPEFATAIGEGKTVSWPTDKGTFTAENNNSGVASGITQQTGAIGYVEYAYATLNGIPTASLENKEGQFIAPSSEAASKALEGVTLPENLRAFVTDPAGADAYPIASYTWILAYPDYENPEDAIAVEAAIQALLNGDTVAKQLGYIPLPESVKQVVVEKADSITPEYSITLTSE